MTTCHWMAFLTLNILVANFSTRLLEVVFSYARFITALLDRDSKTLHPVSQGLLVITSFTALIFASWLPALALNAVYPAMHDAYPFG